MLSLSKHPSFYLLLVALIGLLLLHSCDSNPKKYEHKLYGSTMGTTYAITYISDNEVNYQSSIDSLLVDINNSVSTYIDSSVISQFNRFDENIEPIQVYYETSENETYYDTVYEQIFYSDDLINDYTFSHFGNNVRLSSEIYDLTNGYFDPRISSLVNYYGFGAYEAASSIDSSFVDSLVSVSSLDSLAKFPLIYSNKGDTNVNYSSCVIELYNTNTQLDFSAIAKGYGVDMVGQLLESKGVSNYMVEIGGEVRCQGTNMLNEVWSIGIEKPIEGDITDRELFTIAKLDSLSMATSGNYRNYKEIGGQKVVHIINPKTGYPEISNLLSASVFTVNCATADAYATAFMAMGLEKALKLAEETPNLEAYFIYSNKEGSIVSTSTSGCVGIIKFEE